MKLIDMLINAFEITGDWPQGIDAISQEQHGLIRGYVNVNGHLPMYPLYMLQLSYGLAEDYDTSIVTRSQYEAALAASQKAEWDGSYPIKPGTDVEINFDGDDYRVWTVFRVEYMRGDVVVLHDYRSDDVDAFSNQRLNFRPIRSEADKKREEAIEAIASYALPYKCGADIYDAIADGKIPGVRIE